MVANVFAFSPLLSNFPFPTKCDSLIPSLILADRNGRGVFRTFSTSVMQFFFYFKKVQSKVFHRDLTFTSHVFSDSCIKIKINLSSIFTLLCGTSKGFVNAFKAFLKLFEAPQRRVNIKK